jgi:hypothetical protein
MKQDSARGKDLHAMQIMVKISDDDGVVCMMLMLVVRMVLVWQKRMFKSGVRCVFAA